MKYAMLADNELFEIKETPSLKNNGLPVVKVAYVGVCGTDISYWKHGGRYKGIIPGHEYTGVIVDPGREKFFQVGDCVVGYTQNVRHEYCGHCGPCLAGDFVGCTNRKVALWKGGELNHPGAYSEYTTWFPHSLYKLPEGADLEEAALTEPLTVGFHAVGIAEVKRDDKVLILGGGMAGIAVAEWCRLRRAGEITVIEANREKVERLRSLHVGDHVVPAGEDRIDDILAELSRGGYDIVFDCAGNEEAINMGIRALKKEPYKKFIALALPYKPISVDYTTIVLQQIIVRGSKGHVYGEFTAVARTIAAGEIDVKKYITKVIPFADIQRGFEALKAGGNKEIKAVVKM